MLIGNGSGLSLNTITAGTGIAITNGSGTITIAATGGTGTVTSVGLALPSIFSISNSPVTTSGTLTATFVSESANTVFAAPNGSSGTPTFRALVANDIPTISLTTGVSGILPASSGGTGINTSSATNGQLLIGNGSGLSLNTLTAGSGISITDGSGTITITATGGTGTVTSVGLALPSIFSISNSPVTSSGTLTATFISETANTVFAAPTGIAGVPSFRTLVAADIPTISLTTGVSGVLPPSNGGTGLNTSSAANGQLLIGTGSGLTLNTLTAGSGVTITDGSGTITIAATGSGGTVTSVGLALPSIFTVSGSPVTSAGTLTAVLASETANTVFAAPNGTAGTPTFRALVAADIPTISLTTGVSGILPVANGGTGINTSSAANGQLLIGTGSGLSLNTLTAGSNITVTNASGMITIAAAGSVSSVALVLPSIFTLTGSPITTSGTFTATLASESANTVFAAPNGTAGTPTFRALVAADIPLISLTSGVTGVLPPANGGTGVNTASASNGQLLIGNGSGLSLNTLTAGAGVTITNGSGTITIAATSAGVSSLTGTANEVSVSASTGAVTISTPTQFVAPGTIQDTTGMLYSTAASVSAAGTTQSTATALTTSYVVVTTAAANSGVKLPTITSTNVGYVIHIVNKGANPVNVYPATGSAIDAAGTNTAIVLPVAATIIIQASSTTQWYTIAAPLVAGTGSTVTYGNGQTTVSNAGVTNIVGTANEITVSAGTGAVTVAIANNPILPGTADETIPSGTTTQRPAAPTDAMWRFNTTEEIFEGYASEGVGGYTGTYTPFSDVIGIPKTLIYRKRRVWVDEFMSQQGELGWTTNGTGTFSATVRAATADHLGVVTLAVTGAASNYCAYSLSTTPTVGNVLASQVSYFSFIVSVPSITTAVLATNVGLGDMITDQNKMGNNSIFFSFYPTASANVLFYCQSGGTLSAAVQTAPLVAGNWYLCEAWTNAAGTAWYCAVNKVIYGPITTNIPATAVTPGINCQTLNGTATSIYLDFFSMITTEVGNRHS